MSPESAGQPRSLRRRENGSDCVNRPPLPLMDLPSPEEVFNKPEIGGKDIIMCWPSMIALGAALGSGEWVLGPLMFGRYGFMGSVGSSPFPRRSDRSTWKTRGHPRHRRGADRRLHPHPPGPNFSL